MDAHRTSQKHARFIFICLSALAATASPAIAATRRVPTDYPTIQAAINASTAGDTVLVLPGTYVEHDIRLEGGITLRSERGPDVTTIDAGGQGAVLFLDQDESPVAIEGLTLTGSSATPPQGALVLSSSARVVGCVVRDNPSLGVNCRRGDSVFQSCRFERNQDGISSGTYGSTIVNDCELTDHRDRAISGYGCKIMRCRILRNAVGFSGGGEIRECWVTDNGLGIGMAGQGTVTGCVIARNGTGIDGIFEMADCLVFSNRVGISLSVSYYWATVKQSTISHNDIGLRTGCNPEGRCARVLFDRSILAFPTGGPLIMGECDLARASQARCSDLYDPAADLGCYADLGLNLAVDPRFCDPDHGDFSLAADSPLLEAPGCGLVGAFGVGCGQRAIEEGGTPAARPPFISITPNPVWSSAQIAVRGPMQGGIVEIVTATGRVVDALYVEARGGIAWHPSGDLPSGVYFARVRGDETGTARFVLVR